jgi:hypothetical protein
MPRAVVVRGGPGPRNLRRRNFTARSTTQAVWALLRYLRPYWKHVLVSLVLCWPSRASSSTCRTSPRTPVDEHIGPTAPAALYLPPELRGLPAAYPRLNSWAPTQAPHHRVVLPPEAGRHQTRRPSLWKADGRRRQKIVLVPPRTRTAHPCRRTATPAYTGCLPIPGRAAEILQRFRQGRHSPRRPWQSCAATT